MNILYFIISDIKFWQIISSTIYSSECNYIYAALCISVVVRHTEGETEACKHAHTDTLCALKLLFF